MTEQFFLSNIKCGGCANTIKKELEKLIPDAKAVVDFNNGLVELTSTIAIDRTPVLKKLTSLGYPEEQDNNLVHKAKSFASCMVGRVS